MINARAYYHLRVGAFAKLHGPYGEAGLHVDRDPHMPGIIAFKQLATIDYHDNPPFLLVIVPHWFLVLLYLGVWMGILGGPRLYRYLKERRPPK